MIEIKNVFYEYTGDEVNFALEDVNLTINEGEFLAVLGHNGSGKSTLAKHLNAILLPSQGSIIVDGLNTKDETKLFNIRSIVGMVFQNPDNQMVASVIEEDIAFAPENLGVPQPEIVERVNFALEAVGMSEYRNHAPHLLSGGQKQRIAIAGVLAMKPKYIVLDEPTAMLDPIGRAEVMKTLHKLNKEGITIILITHNMDEAVQADRVVVMNKGRVLLNDTPKKVFQNIEMIKKIGLDIPQPTELLWELKKRGYNVRTDILTNSEAYNELKILLQGERN